MAHQHAVTERAPRELLGRLQPAWMQEASLAVYNIGVAIEHAGTLGGRIFVKVALVDHLFQRVGLGKEVAGIEEYHIFAGGLRQPLVHGVVDAVVGFRLDDDFVAVVRRVAPLLVLLGQGHCPVGGRPVDYQVLHVLVCLVEHAVEGALHDLFGIVGDGDY